MSYQHNMKCPICGSKETCEVEGEGVLPVEVCESCGFETSEFVPDLEVSVIGTPDELQRLQPGSVTEIVIALVSSGHSVHIQPHRLQNVWLGLDVIGFCVDVKKSNGELISNGIHASLLEALSDAWLLMPGVLPDEEV